MTLLKKKFLTLGLISVLVMVGAAAVWAAAGVTFTGDAVADFVGAPGTVKVKDAGGIGDVGLPATAPPGTISGWDMEAVYFHYDPGTDTMYVGIDTPGIFGDSDGDGDPGGTAPWLAALGKADLPMLESSEYVSLLFDADCSGTFDTGVDFVVGESGFFGSALPLPPSPGPFIPGGFGVYSYVLFGPPSINFGPSLPVPAAYHNPPVGPTAGMPDFEFTIGPGFSTLFAGCSTPPDFTVKKDFPMFVLSAGADNQDDGIGEEEITAVELVDFSAIVVGDKVHLRWETASELDNAGFNVYRISVVDGAARARTQVNGVLLAAEGSIASGATYTYIDTPDAGEYFYVLEDVDTSGLRTAHGPVVVKVAPQDLPFRFFMPFVQSLR